jgi:hypothetical protein
MSAKSNRFVPVTADRPCAICHKGDWCRLSVDGAVAECKRVADGAFKTKDTAAGTAHYHRLTGSASPPSGPPIPPAGAEVPRADPDTLNAVYSALLAALSLSSAHRDNLARRGLHRPGAIPILARPGARRNRA